MTISTTETFLFGPQATLPPTRGLDQLRQALVRRTKLYGSLIDTLKDLPDLLQQLVSSDPTLKRIPVTGSIEFIIQWLDSGTLSVPVDSLPNVVSVPFAVLLQLALLLVHLAKNKVGTEYDHTVLSLQKYGAQGFCTGFLTAAAVSFSATEDELAKNIGTSLRLAMCIGAYIDANAAFNEPPNPVCAFSARWRQSEFSKSQIEDVLNSFTEVCLQYL